MDRTVVENKKFNVTARYELSHQDLHCLHMLLCWSAGLKGLLDRTKARPLKDYVMFGYSERFIAVVR